jgi:hypothetical protein
MACGRDNTWWGEAPDRSRTLPERLAPSLCKNAVTPLHVPSRDLARTTARRALRPSNAVQRNSPDFLCSHPRSFGSLAPPKVSPTRPYAVTPLRFLPAQEVVNRVVVMLEEK